MQKNKNYFIALVIGLFAGQIRAQELESALCLPKKLYKFHLMPVSRNSSYGVMTRYSQSAHSSKKIHHHYSSQNK